MNWLRAQLTRTPLAARVVPFVLFVVLTFTQEWFGPAGRYWIYLVKSILGAAMLAAVWPAVAEMRWPWSWEAFAVGVSMFVLWAGLDDFLVLLGWKGSYPKLNFGTGAAWNPHAQFGQASELAWFFIVVRIAGATLVVPPLEETF